MISTRNLLIEEIEKRFSVTTFLGHELNEDKPTYSHIDSKSGIGCAVGCLLSPENAEALQKICKNTGNYTIRRLLAKYGITELDSIRHYGVENLVLVQALHDSSIDLDDFLHRLRLQRE